MKRERLVWTLMGLGWYIGLSIALPLLAGWWLDGKASTSPWFTILGLVLGLIIAFVGTYRMLQTLEQQQSNKKEN